MTASVPRSGRISPVTVGRRTWMEWFGQATVLSLGHVLLGCGDEGGASTNPAGAGGSPGEAGSPTDGGADSPQPGPDASGLDAAADSPVTACPGELPFQPGPGADPVFSGWGERTVDEQDLALLLANWRLVVDGLVDEPRTFTFQELACLPRQDQLTDFHCVEGWSIYDVPWNGVHLSHLFALVKPTAAATHVAFHSAGGKYDESLPLDIALEPRTMLGIGVAGSSLPLAHGFPLRAVIPRLLGYKNAKYITRIELTDHPVIGFWSNLGYPYEGEVPPARLRPGKY